MTNTDVRAAAPADRELVVRLAFGSMAAQTLRAAVRLRVVELVGGTPRPATAVAVDAGAEPQPMTRLLRALAGLGLLREHTPGSFSVTPAGGLLDPGHPDSLTSFVRMFTEPAIVRAWDIWTAVSAPARSPSTPSSARTSSDTSPGTPNCRPGSARR